MDSSSPRTRRTGPLRMTITEEYIESGNDESVECELAGHNDEHGISIRILSPTIPPPILFRKKTERESREETLVVEHSNGDGSDGGAAGDEARIGTSKDGATQNCPNGNEDSNNNNNNNNMGRAGKDPKSFREDIDLSFVISIRRSRILRKISQLREQIKLSLTQDERSTFEESLKIEIRNLERKNLEQEQQSGVQIKTEKKAPVPSKVAIADDNDSAKTTNRQDNANPEAPVNDDGMKVSE